MSRHGHVMGGSRFVPSEPTVRRDDIVNYLITTYDDHPAMIDVAMKVRGMMDAGVTVTRDLIDYMIADENDTRMRQWVRNREAEKRAARQLREQIATYVYFIEHGDRIKIGYSANPKQRAQALSLRESNILAVIEGDRTLESRLHARFAHLRDGTTEWFAKADDLMEFIEQYGERYTKHHRSRRVDFDKGADPVRDGYARLAEAMGVTLTSAADQVTSD